MLADGAVVIVVALATEVIFAPVQVDDTAINVQVILFVMFFFVILDHGFDEWWMKNDEQGDKRVNGKTIQREIGSVGWVDLDLLCVLLAI